MIKAIIGILWFILTIGVLINVWKKDQSSSLNKILWTLGILTFPFLGPVAWIIFGERTGA